MKIFNNSEDAKTKAQVFYTYNRAPEEGENDDWALYSDPYFREEATLDQVLSAYLDGNVQAVMYYVEDNAFVPSEVESLLGIGFNSADNLAEIYFWDSTTYMDLDYDAIEKYYGNIIPDEFKGN